MADGYSHFCRISCSCYICTTLFALFVICCFSFSWLKAICMFVYLFMNGMGMSNVWSILCRCTVCLAEYQEKDVLRILPYCGHTFHITCIDIWLKQHSTCPVCRISLRDSPDRKRAMQPVYSATIRSYLPETLESDPCHHRYAGHGFSDRTSENRRMDSTRADHFSSEPSGTLGTVSTLSEVNCSIKNACHHETEGKHIESPSYS